MSDDMPGFNWHGDVRLYQAGDECYDIDLYEGDRFKEDLADALLQAFKSHRTDDGYDLGRLSIAIVQVKAPDPPPPKTRRSYSVLAYFRDPACNCVHIHAPDEHLTYCTTWGGKRLPGTGEQHG